MIDDRRVYEIQATIVRLRQRKSQAVGSPTHSQIQTHVNRSADQDHEEFVHINAMLHRIVKV